VRISRNTLIAGIISILVHVILFTWVALKKIEFDNAPKEAPPPPMVVNLSPAPEPQIAMNEPPAPVPESVPPPKEVKPKQKSKPKAPERTLPKDIIALDKRGQESIETPPPKPAPPSPEPVPSTPLPTDMMSYVTAQRERRRAAEGYAPRENTEAREHTPTQDEIRDATIKRNLQAGANGIFQIVNMSQRNAQFIFRGWTNDYSNARRELIQVEAGADGDIQRAIVRRMIELIRRDYKGDFNWESQRLGRVVILSARLQDQAGLEDFLVTEFFGVAGKSFN